MRKINIELLSFQDLLQFGKSNPMVIFIILGTSEIEIWWRLLFVIYLRDDWEPQRSDFISFEHPFRYNKLQLQRLKIHRIWHTSQFFATRPRIWKSHLFQHFCCGGPDRILWGRPPQTQRSKIIIKLRILPGCSRQFLPVFPEFITNFSTPLKPKSTILKVWKNLWWTAEFPANWKIFTKRQNTLALFGTSWFSKK